ncbi:NAD-dependent epimerase/dehydratase family protein [Nostoc sp. CHAB 5834]|nr:NAD-dependent epimerase/dehydratase family protein [Nostoc sp. CHAB 5834]
MIVVTGATGFLGKRVCRLLENSKMAFCKTSLSLGTDLRDILATRAFFDKVRPDYVLNCAAYVGGIQFGFKHPAELFQNNLLMTINLLQACTEFGIKRMVNPISNCAYPGEASLFREDEFWDGPLHESVMVYGFARKASWVGSWAFGRQYGNDVINLILSNMYGPEDHFEEERSHALGALIMKIIEAKHRNQSQVTVWGSGQPVREWLHVDDGAEAMVRSLDVPATSDILNIGVGKGISIIDLAEMIKQIVEYDGQLITDPSKPDGAPYKTVDGSKAAAHFGWTPSRELRAGIEEAVQYYSAKRNLL